MPETLKFQIVQHKPELNSNLLRKKKSRNAKIYPLVHNLLEFGLHCMEGTFNAIASFTHSLCFSASLSLTKTKKNRMGRLGYKNRYWGALMRFHFIIDKFENYKDPQGFLEFLEYSVLRKDPTWPARKTETFILWPPPIFLPLPLNLYREKKREKIQIQPHELDARRQGHCNNVLRGNNSSGLLDPA